MKAQWLVFVLCFGLCKGCQMPPADPAFSRPFMERQHVGTLSYLRAGDETQPRIIYIHGTPGDAGAFAAYLREPVAELESVSVDRLGFGQSRPDQPETSFAAQARAIEPLLAERGSHGPILVGHSLGGPIAAQLAATHPDRVRGLVILAGSLDPSLEKLRWYNHVARTPPIRWLLKRHWRHANAEVLAARQQTQVLAPLLERITCPVVIVHGTRDKLVPYANVAYTQQMLTGASSVELVRLEGVQHFIPWTHADAVRRAIEQLVALTSAEASRK